MACPLRRLKHFDVHEVVDEGEATGHVVDAKWSDRQKGSVVRCRIVARQFATKSLEHLFAGTPDATALRAMLSKLATDKDKVLLVADVTSAYNQSASGDRPISASTDRPKRERQALEVEAGDAPVSDLPGQVAAGPLRVSCGGGAGTRGRLLTRPPSRSRRTERFQPSGETT